MALTRLPARHTPKGHGAPPPDLGQPVRESDQPGLRRLSNDEFIALRSLHKGAWVMHHGFFFHWKHNRRWWYVNGSSGYATRYIDCGPAELPKIETRFLHQAASKARLAHESLRERGLARTTVDRCCPGTDCHRNDRLVFEPTEAGTALIEAQAMSKRGAVSTLKLLKLATQIRTRLLRLLRRT